MSNQPTTTTVRARVLALAFAVLMIASSAGVAAAAPSPPSAAGSGPATGQAGPTGIGPAPAQEATTSPAVTVPTRPTGFDGGPAGLEGGVAPEAAATTERGDLGATTGGEDLRATGGTALGRFNPGIEYHSRPATGSGAHCPDDLDGNACITGQFMYEDGNGGFAPARQVLVQLKDDDWAANHLVREVHTDDHGRFAIVFDIEHIDGWSENSVFLKVFAQNPAAKTTSGAARRVYRAVSETKSVDGGETLDLGVMTPEEQDSAWKGADWMLTAQRRTAEEADGWTRRRVRIQHPDPIASRPQAVGIPAFRHVGLPETSEWNWGQSTVTHEYGHMVLDTLYDYKIYNWPAEAAEYVGVCHTEDSETNPGFAWIEGFAEFYEGVVADRAHVGGKDLEDSGDYDTATSNGDCPGGDTGEMDGASVEGSVAGILWDVYDPKDDDGLHYSLDEIFETVDRHNVKNAHEFWDAFRTPGNHEELRQIYYDHGIVKPDRFESNDRRSAAPTIPTGEAVGAQISGSDVDYFAVDVEANKEVTATVDTDWGEPDLEVAVVAGDGSELASATGEATASVDSAGTYYVKVEDRSDETVPYEVTVETTSPPIDLYEPPRTLDPDEIPELDLTEIDLDGLFADVDVVDGIDFDPVESELAIDRGEGSTPDLGATADRAGQVEQFDGALAAGDRAVHEVAVTVPEGCTLEVRLLGADDADLDLYATLDARTPTTADFDRKAATDDHVETLSIDGKAVPDDGRIGLLVDAYAGSGEYAVVVAVVESDEG